MTAPAEDDPCTDRVGGVVKAATTLRRRELMLATASLALWPSPTQSHGDTKPTRAAGPQASLDHDRNSVYRSSSATSGPGQLNAIADRLKEIVDALNAAETETSQEAAAATEVRSRYDQLSQSLAALPSASEAAASIVRAIALVGHHVELICSWRYITERLKLAERVSTALDSSSYNFGLRLSLADNPILIDEWTQITGCDRVPANQVVLRIPLNIQLIDGRIVLLTVRVPMSCGIGDVVTQTPNRLAVNRAAATTFEGKDFWPLPNAGYIAETMADTLEHSIDDALSQHTLQLDWSLDLGNLPSGFGFDEHDVLRVWPISCDLRGGLRCYGMLWTDVIAYILSDGTIRPTTTTVPRLSLKTTDIVPTFTAVPRDFDILLKFPTIRTSKWFEWIIWQEVDSRVNGNDVSVSPPAQRSAQVIQLHLTNGETTNAILEGFYIVYTGQYAHLINGTSMVRLPLLVDAFFSTGNATTQRNLALVLNFIAFIPPAAVEKIVPLNIYGRALSADIADPFTTVSITP